MALYRMSFFGKLDQHWLRVAESSPMMPRLVRDMLEGEPDVIVDGRHLDAICEWDRGIAKLSNSRAQIEYWPVGIGKN